MVEAACEPAAPEEGRVADDRDMPAVMMPLGFYGNGCQRDHERHAAEHDDMFMLERTDGSLPVQTLHADRATAVPNRLCRIREEIEGETLLLRRRCETICLRLRTP